MSLQDEQRWVVHVPVRAREMFAAFHVMRAVSIAEMFAGSVITVHRLHELAYAFDTEMTPMWPERRMLRCVGVEPKKSDECEDALEVSAELEEMIRGLALWNTFITGADYMTDAQLLDRLHKAIDEPRRAIPPMHKFRFIINLEDERGGRPDVTSRDKHLPISPDNVVGHGEYFRDSI